MKRDGLHVGIRHLARFANDRRLKGDLESIQAQLQHSTYLEVAIGPRVKIFHGDCLTEGEASSIKSAIEDARLQATRGFEDLSSGGDQDVGAPGQDFQNSFKFEMTERPRLSKFVVDTVGLIKTAVMSENLSIKFYRKEDGNKEFSSDPEPSGYATRGFSSKKGPHVIVALGERAFDFRSASSVLNHEIGHNVAALKDHGRKGYGGSDFTEVENRMIGTWAIASKHDGKALQPLEAIAGILVVQRHCCRSWGQRRHIYSQILICRAWGIEPSVPE